MNLKKIGKVFTSKFVGTGSLSCKKNNLPGRGLTKVDKHCCKASGRSEEPPSVFFDLLKPSGFLHTTMFNIHKFYMLLALR